MNESCPVTAAVEANFIANSYALGGEGARHIETMPERGYRQAARMRK